MQLPGGIRAVLKVLSGLAYQHSVREAVDKNIPRKTSTLMPMLHHNEKKCTHIEATVA